MHFVLKTGSFSGNHLIPGAFRGFCLNAPRWTAGRGYRTSPDSIALFAERVDLANMADAAVAAVSGATPGSGALAYVCGLSDMDGNTFRPGGYMDFIEGALLIVAELEKTSIDDLHQGSRLSRLGRLRALCHGQSRLCKSREHYE